MAYILDAVYFAVLLAASPWLIWRALTTQRYREGLLDRFLGRTPEVGGGRPVVWLHAVSLGEVNLLGPVLAELEQRRPGWLCVISTTTKTGLDQARRKFPNLPVFYAPLDFSWAVRAAMRRLQPRLLVLVELELWPNLIDAARRQGAAVAIINGRLSPRSFRGYLRVRPLAARWLSRVDCIAAQNDEYAKRFRDLGAPRDRVVVTGSIKFDGAETNRQNLETTRLARLAGIGPDDPVFLAGSTQAPEEQFALATFRRCRQRHRRLRLILVPRHPERFAEVAEMLDRSGEPWQRRTNLEHGAPAAARVLLVDAVGELRAWWGTAQIAFVGGSLSTRGGQNMIEPAGYGAAISFGPNTRNFRDIVALLLEDRAATVVQNAAEMLSFVEHCLADPAAAAEQGARAQRLVQSQQGATRRTVDRLLPLADRPPALSDEAESQRDAA